MNKLIMILVMLIIGIGLLVPTIEAGKIDKGPKGQKINGVVEFDPVSPIHTGDIFIVKGSGFAEGRVHISAANPGCCLAFSVGANANGEWAFLWVAGTAPGTYVFRAFQGQKKNGKHWEVYGIGSIEVLS